MTESQSKKSLVKADEIAGLPEVHLRHPWNPKSDIYIRQLWAVSGLQRQQISLARVPPGKESFLYHAHERDEEFLFILSGRGRALIDGQTFEVGPGDFMGFTAPGVAHHLMNPYAEDLVYLMGGERSGMDIAHFPSVGRKAVFSAGGIWAVEDRDVKQLSFADYLAKD
jgi:uncharacterized cupin superfamily protein